MLPKLFSAIDSAPLAILLLAVVLAPGIAVSTAAAAQTTRSGSGGASTARAAFSGAVNEPAAQTTRSVSGGASAARAAFSGAGNAPAARAEALGGWVASWTASPQPLWDKDFPFPTYVPAMLDNQTLRQVSRISLGGSRVRVMFSNAYGSSPIVIGGASVALTDNGPAIRAQSLRTLTFGGSATATLSPGAPLLSDPVNLPVPALAHLTVSVYLPSATPTTTFHWDGRQTAWIVTGDQTAARTLDNGGAAVRSITARTLLTGIDVQGGPSAGRAVAVIGDSITDGNGVTVDSDARWPDFLAARLAPHGVAVINAGISGARLLFDKMGVNALARFDRDVLSQPGVRTAIVLLGINDISWPGTAFDPKGQQPSLAMLEAGYKQLIAQAHRRGVRIIGVTLTPFAGALQGTPLDNYFNADKDRLRQRLNSWIRQSGAFDAVLDFDQWTRDRADPRRLDPVFDSGDHLHPGDDGNRRLARAISLDILLPKPDAVPSLDAAQQ